MSSTEFLSVGQCASLACLLEATISKPGNVHRGVDFEGLTFTDFAVSSVAISPAMQAAHETGVGTAVLAAIEATHKLVNTNTNLGLCLLLAPLAAVDANAPSIREGLKAVLAALTPADSQAIYEAIRTAKAGGLGKTEEMDVAGEAPDDLLAAMRAAADRDLIALQYTNDFAQVFEVADWISEQLTTGHTLSVAVIQAQLQLMAAHPDTLIARKAGIDTAKRASHIASLVVESGKPESPEWIRSLSDLDFWLRSDGHKRNPGATADAIGAALFILLRKGEIQSPIQ